MSAVLELTNVMERAAQASAGEGRRVVPECDEAVRVLIDAVREAAAKDAAELERLRGIEHVATQIMLDCNESSTCPLCGADAFCDDEHEPDGWCAALDVALSGPRKAAQ